MSLFRNGIKMLKSPWQPEASFLYDLGLLFN